MNLLNKIDPPIDYIGQYYVSKYMKLILIFGYIFSLIAGFITNDLKYTLSGSILTVLICILVTIPPWPIYRRNPVLFKEVKKD